MSSTAAKVITPEKTPRKKTAKFNNTDFKQFLDISKAMWMLGTDQGEIIKHNSVLENITGLKSNEIQSKHFIDLFSEQDREELLSAMQKSAAKDPFEYEARILTQNGETRWVKCTQRLYKDMLYCVAHDIQDEKTREKDFSRHKNQLLEAESIGRMGHWSWVLGGDDIEWAEQIYRIFGVDQKSYEPTLDSMNAMVDRNDIMRVNQVFERAIIEENDYDMEFSILRPDGETRFIHCEGRCAFDEDGDVYALYGIMQDMTERMLYERELKSAKDAAERAYAAKTQFLANMSHELRTPLNAIIGFSDMMEQQLLGPLGNEKYLDYISGIRESGTHLLDLISDILDMSKIEAGKYELALEELNIHKIIQLSVHMMEGRANETGAKITTTSTEEDELKIVADRRGLLQIMLNLLSNAVKFSKEDGEISIECSEQDNGIALKIVDNGIGIPANKLATITNPFEQVSSSYARDHEGSGLGLAITKELAELHNGSLSIESTVDVGTTVTVALPFKPEVQIQE